jgi:hypothetical protein
MIYSEYLTDEAPSSKWEKMRINYDLLKQVLKVKEHLGADYMAKPNSNLKVKTVFYEN